MNGIILNYIFANKIKNSILNQMNRLYSLNRKQNWVTTEAFANKIRKTKKRGDHCLLIKN